MSFKTVKPLTRADTLYVNELEEPCGPAPAVKQGILLYLLSILFGKDDGWGGITTFMVGEEDGGIF